MTGGEGAFLTSLLDPPLTAQITMSLTNQPRGRQTFEMADRFKSENFSRAGLKNEHKYSAIKFYFSPYYNSDSMRTMSLAGFAATRLSHLGMMGLNDTRNVSLF